MYHYTWIWIVDFSYQQLPPPVTSALCNAFSKFHATLFPSFDMLIFGWKRPFFDKLFVLIWTILNLRQFLTKLWLNRPYVNIKFLVFLNNLFWWSYTCQSLFPLFSIMLAKKSNTFYKLCNTFFRFYYSIDCFLSQFYTHSILYIFSYVTQVCIGFSRFFI